MIPKSCVTDLSPYEPGKPIEDVKKEFGLSEVIKLASNENPFGFSTKVREAINEETGQLNVYPDGASQELKETVASFLNVGEDQLIFGAGSDEIITMLSRVYIEPGDRTIMAKPTFSQYYSNVKIENADIVEVPLKNGLHDLDAMKAQINDRTKIIWVCSPNNPTGTIVKEGDLLAFLQDVPEDVMVVLDEAYYEYVTDADYPDSIPLLDRYPNLILLRTFSKIYGLSALRVGYGIGHPTLIELLNRVRGPFNTTRLSQKAAIAAIKDQTFIQECRSRNEEGKQQLCQAFDDMNLSYYPSDANFVLVDTQQDADRVFQKLLKRGLIVRSGQALGYPTSIRITIGSRQENDKLLTALSDVLQGEVRV